MTATMPGHLDLQSASLVAVNQLSDGKFNYSLINILGDAWLGLKIPNMGYFMFQVPCTTILVEAKS